MQKETEMNHDRIFAPHQYFWQIGQLLIAAGMKFLAKVVITSEDARYYVGGDYARVTSLFYNRQGKALIVQLALHEHHGFLDRGYESYWSLEFFCEESVDSWVELHQKRIEEDELADDLDDPQAWGLLEVEGLRGGSGYHGETVSPGWEVQRRFDLDDGRPDWSQRSLPEVITSPIITAVRQVEPVLSDRFHELSVWDFPPSYVFPGCVPIFWKRFPTRRLQPLAKRIVGIKFQPD